MFPSLQIHYQPVNISTANLTLNIDSCGFLKYGFNQC